MPKFRNDTNEIPSVSLPVKPIPYSTSKPFPPASPSTVPFVESLPSSSLALAPPPYPSPLHPPSTKSFRNHLDSFLDSITFGLIMTLATLYSLFGVDVRYAISLDEETDFVFLSLTAVVLILFIIEITLRAIIRDDYLPLPPLLTGKYPPYSLPLALRDPPSSASVPPSSNPTGGVVLANDGPTASALSTKTTLPPVSSVVSVNRSLYTPALNRKGELTDTMTVPLSNTSVTSERRIINLHSLSSLSSWMTIKRNVSLYLYNLYYFISLFRCGSFYFWLDLVATLSMGLDIPIILFDMQDNYSENVSYAENSATEISIARAGRASRAGARTGRLLRLIAIVRLLRITRLSRPLTQTLPKILEWGQSKTTATPGTSTNDTVTHEPNADNNPSAKIVSTVSSSSVSLSSPNTAKITASSATEASSSSTLSSSSSLSSVSSCCGRRNTKSLFLSSHTLGYYLFTAPVYYIKQFREQFEIARIALSRETRVGAKLTSLMTQRIIVGVLLLIIAIPLLMYHSTDSTLNYAIAQVHGLAVGAAVAEHNYYLTNDQTSSSSSSSSSFSSSSFSSVVYAAAARDRAIDWLFFTQSPMILDIRLNDTWLQVPPAYNFNNTYFPLSSGNSTLTNASFVSSLPSWTNNSIYMYSHEPSVHGYLRSSDVFTIDMVATILVYRNETYTILNYDSDLAYIESVHPSFFNESGDIVSIQYWVTHALLYSLTIEQENAIWGTGLTLFIITILGVGAALFSYDTNRLVLRPLEKMVEVVRRISLNPLTPAYQVLNNPFQPPSSGTTNSYRRNLTNLLSSHHQAHLFDTKYLFHNSHGHKFDPMSSSSSTHAVSGVGEEETFLQHIISSERNKRRSARAKALEIDEGEALETRLLLRTLLNMGSLLKVGFGEQGANIITHNLNKVQELNPVIPGNQKYAIFVRIGLSTELLTKLSISLGEEMVLVLNTIANAIHRTVSLHNGIILGQENNASSFLVAWPLMDVDASKVSSMDTKDGGTYGSGTGLGEEASSTNRNTNTKDSTNTPSVTAWSRTADMALQCILRCYVCIGRDCSSILAHPNEIPIEPFTGKLPLPRSNSSYGNAPVVSSTTGHAHASRYIFISDTGRQRLFAMLPNIRTEMGCYLTSVLHAGWGIEGPLGSDRKIDATMTGPHIELTKRLLNVGWSYRNRPTVARSTVNDSISPGSLTKEYIDYLQKGMEHIPGAKEMITALAYANDLPTIQRPVILLTHPFFALLTPEGQTVCRRVDRIRYQKASDVAILSTYEPWTVYTPSAPRSDNDDRPMYRPELDTQPPSVVPLMTKKDDASNVSGTNGSTPATKKKGGSTATKGTKSTVSKSTKDTNKSVKNDSSNASTEKSSVSPSRNSSKSKRTLTSKTNSSTVTVNTNGNTSTTLSSSSASSTTNYIFAYKRLTDISLRPRTLFELQTVQQQLLYHETTACYDHAIDLYGYDIDPRVLRLLAGEINAITLPLRPFGNENTTSTNPNLTGAENSRAYHSASSFIITGVDKYHSTVAPTPSSGNNNAPSNSNTNSNIPLSSTLSSSNLGLFDRFDLSSFKNLRKISSSTKSLATLTNTSSGNTNSNAWVASTTTLPVNVSPIDSPKRTLQEQKQFILPSLTVGLPAVPEPQNTKNSSNRTGSNSLSIVHTLSSADSKDSDTLSISARALLETPSYPADLSSILSSFESSTGTFSSSAAAVTNPSPLRYTNVWRTDILLRALRRHALPVFRSRMNAAISILYGSMNSVNYDAMYGTLSGNPPPPTLSLLRMVEDEERLWINHPVSFRAASASASNKETNPVTLPTSLSLSSSSSTLVPLTIYLPYDLQVAIRFLLFGFYTTGDDSIYTILLNIGKYIYTYYHTSIHDRNKDGPVWPLPARRYG